MRDQDYHVVKKEGVIDNRKKLRKRCEDVSCEHFKSEVSLEGAIRSVQVFHCAIEEDVMVWIVHHPVYDYDARRTNLSIIQICQLIRVQTSSTVLLGLLIEDENETAFSIR